MKGADEYYDLFKTGQYGRLYVERNKHARGKTFHIFVLPKDCKIDKATFNPHGNSKVVEVYGLISGQCGWSECYGWLHDGIFQKDFEALVERRKAIAKLAANKKVIDKLREDKIKKNRVQDLLSGYKKGDCL